MKSILYRFIIGVLDFKNDYEGLVFLEFKKLMFYFFVEKLGIGEKKEKDVEIDVLFYIV